MKKQLKTNFILLLLVLITTTFSCSKDDLSTESDLVNESILPIDDTASSELFVRPDWISRNDASGSGRPHVGLHLQTPASAERVMNRQPNRDFLSFWNTETVDRARLAEYLAQQERTCYNNQRAILGRLGMGQSTSFTVPALQEFESSIGTIERGPRNRYTTRFGSNVFRNVRIVFVRIAVGTALSSYAVLTAFPTR
jgi:hypothetical protein